MSQRWVCITASRHDDGNDHAMNTTTDASHAVDASRTAGRISSRGAIVAAVIGNWLEFFDFTIYGFFAVIIGRLFFPSADPATSLLLCCPSRLSRRVSSRGRSAA